MKDDMIRRDALLEFAGNHIDGKIDCNDIARFPYANAEPVRHGRWINKTEKHRGFSDYRFDCSACNHIFWVSGIETFKHCPWCGAKMDAEVEG